MVKKELEPFAKWFDERKSEIMDNYFKYLRFPSISTHPDRVQDSLECAQFLIEYIKKMGLEVDLIETSKEPFIFAQNLKAGPDKPTLLLYHHYDVQPVDPLELWDSAPFEPEIRDGKIFARGASDNKGQGFYTLTAIDAFLQLKQMSNFNLKLVIEGGEECGSEGLSSALPSHRDLFKADYLLIVDSNMEDLSTPQICLGMKGIACFDLEVITSDSDLHSGEWGGISANSIKVLIKALSSVTDDEGGIIIDDFYNDVVDPTPDEKKIFFSRDLDEVKLKKQHGIRAFAKEPGRSLIESGWMRPTFEINGITGGYSGDGFKTVIAAKASAKISFRTVANQDPKRIELMFHDHLEKVIPKGVEWNLHAHGAGRYMKSDLDCLIVEICKQAYSDVFEKECQLRMIGGSVPVAADIADASGAKGIAIGTAISDNQIHAPNEFFYYESFEKGFLTITRIFDILENSQ
ncbi:MAG: M20/M25/M40 family metallo-hydrolase [Rhabdochlamydiaceae bacterium]|nr:M20/M25/M40 family metallo-hydrolase [Candidatus Amphrikana amoebophyrae]